MNALLQLFDEAAEIDDPARRAAFIRAACGEDAGLFARLENLLRAHEEAGGFLNTPDEPGLVLADQPSERIGRYKLLQKLGEGGYGVVYMAEQTEPVKRRVALKVIKLGMDTRSVIARFEAERQALALMDHPNIAHVLDAGATETGRPYFVMELVRGIKITDYCDQHSLAMPQRLALFVQVCQAVQHAHQKGIIHRDLKPSNILVMSQDDGTPLPKVIDFGIAKATADLQLTDKTLFTRFEMFIGTPAYMSPEQAEFNAADVDTRTDIYALGVLLYELLTGRTPFDGEQLLKAGLESMRRTIRETEPARPSTRLKALAAADLTEVAKRRQAEPMRLMSQVHGDLDWIALKAMEKDRRRRYETANALAMDVRRFLKHEPIVARPPSALYALQKMARRNRAAFLAGAAVFAMLVLGVVASLWQAFRATRAEKRERESRVAAESNERLAKQAQKAASELAEQNQRQLVRMHVAAGQKLMDERDDYTALLHFVEALRLEIDPAREVIHRRRLGSVLRAAPRLAWICFHEGYVHHVGFRPDGQRVVTVAFDQTARIWDTTTGELATPAIRLEPNAMGARFSRDGARLFTLDEQKRLRLWDAASGSPLSPDRETVATFLDQAGLSPDGRWLALPTKEGLRFFDAETANPGRLISKEKPPDSTLLVSPDGRLLAERDNRLPSLGLWDLTVEPPRRTELPHSANVRGFSFSPDGQHVGAHTLREVAVWDVARGKKIWPSFEPGGDLFDCQFSPDGRLFATASWDGRARVFDTATGLPVGDSMKHRMGIAHAIFSPDGAQLATASWDSTARLWNPRTGAPVSPAMHHGGFVNMAVFSPDGARLATSSQDQTARLWELKPNETWGRALRGPAGVRIARFSPDGSRILAGCFDGTFKVWEAATARELATMKLPGFCMDGDFSPDGAWVVIGDNTGRAQVFESSTGKAVGPEVRHAVGLWTVDFSPDGRHILTCSADRTARVWDGVTGQAITEPLTHAGEVKVARFSPDGRLLATGSYDGTAQLWDARTGQKTGPAMKHDCELWDLEFSHDGKRLITAPSDRSQLPRAAQMWDTATSQPVGPPLTHIDGVLRCTFSPDGRYVATGSEDKSATVWDVATGARLTPPLVHRSYVMAARFSPDSRMLLTVGSEGAARVWEAATGEPITPPLVHENEALDGDWSPDGNVVITCGADKTVRVWDVSPTAKTLDALRREAELLSAHRLQDNLGAVLLSTKEIRERWEAEKQR